MFLTIIYLYFFILENIHLFRDEAEEEEEIIEKLLNQEDFFLRYTAPELFQEPAIANPVNDICRNVF